MLLVEVSTISKLTLLTAAGCKALSIVFQTGAWVTESV
jgi:hypothetical protein